MIQSEPASSSRTISTPKAGAMTLLTLSGDDKAVAELRASLDTLTLREREVMVLVVAGLQNKQIAHEIGVVEATVKVHRGQVMREMRAKVIGRAGQNGRQAEALSPKVERALDQGLITSLLLLNGFRRTGD